MSEACLFPRASVSQTLSQIMHTFTWMQALALVEAKHEAFKNTKARPNIDKKTNLRGEKKIKEWRSFDDPFLSRKGRKKNKNRNKQKKQEYLWLTLSLIGLINPFFFFCVSVGVQIGMWSCVWRWLCQGSASLCHLAIIWKKRRFDSGHCRRQRWNHEMNLKTRIEETRSLSLTQHSCTCLFCRQFLNCSLLHKKKFQSQ